MDIRRRDSEGRSLKQKSFAFIRFQSLHCKVIASFEFVEGVMSSNSCFILLRCDKMRSFLVKNAFFESSDDVATSDMLRSFAAWVF